MVSVLIATYNHEKYIAKTIESALNQKTNFDYEIVIHDDASTDRTQQIIREYEKNIQIKSGRSYKQKISLVNVRLRQHICIRR